MNVFRLAGDMSHVVSIFLLILKLIATKNAQGTVRLFNAALATFFTTCLNLQHFLRLSTTGLNLLFFYSSGISLKTQELFLLVFVTRYLDLFTTYYSAYNRYP